MIAERERLTQEQMMEEMISGRATIMISHLQFLGEKDRLTDEQLIEQIQSGAMVEKLRGMADLSQQTRGALMRNMLETGIENRHAPTSVSPRGSGCSRPRGRTGSGRPWQRPAAHGTSFPKRCQCLSSLSLSLSLLLTLSLLLSLLLSPLL